MSGHSSCNMDRETYCSSAVSSIRPGWLNCPYASVIETAAQADMLIDTRRKLHSIETRREGCKSEVGTTSNLSHCEVKEPNELHAVHDLVRRRARGPRGKDFQRPRSAVGTNCWNCMK